MSSKVAIALSGGIDSAVAAALLIEKGFEVIGITGYMTESKDSDEVVFNAQKVAKKLNIKHYTYNATKEFSKYVSEYFLNSYKNGKTPNPCIMCNKYIKWGSIFEYATKDLNADYIATGHYANIIKDGDIYKLYPAIDEIKDQLYFLFSLKQEQLSKTIFPLSEYKKQEVKNLAMKYDLPPKSSKESQDICFIKHPMTTKKYLNNLIEPVVGNFIEQSTGKILGNHNGYWQYTIGQRKGIGIAAPEALYVTKLDSASNTVYVGYKDELFLKQLILQDFDWNYPQNSYEFQALVKIRYNMKATPAKITISDDVNIEFEEQVSGIAPGQACVLYDINDGHLLGGGFI